MPTDAVTVNEAYSVVYENDDDLVVIAVVNSLPADQHRAGKLMADMIVSRNAWSACRRYVRSPPDALNHRRWPVHLLAGRLPFVIDNPERDRV